MFCKKITLMTTLSATILLGGCAGTNPLSLIGAPQDSIVKTNQKTYPKIKPKKVKLYINGEKPKCNYTTIGTASIDNTQWFMSRSIEKKYKLLKIEASKMGGNGVMNITESFDHTDGTIIHC
jgi:hypothetical protein